MMLTLSSHHGITCFPEKEDESTRLQSCVICQERKPKYKDVLNPDKSLFEKLLRSMSVRHSHGDTKYSDNLSTLGCKIYNEFIEIGQFGTLNVMKMSHTNEISKV